MASAVEEKKAVKPLSLYEAMVVLNASLGNEEVEKAIDKIKEMVNRNAGEVAFVENMGKRKLAYEVAKEKRGIYILVQFKGISTTVSGLQRAFKLDDSIIRFITMKISQNELRTPEIAALSDAPSSDVPSDEADMTTEESHG